MEVYHKHPWRISINEAREVQTKLRSHVLLNENGLPLKSIQTIAAADISYSLRDKNLFAAVVIFSFPELELITAKAGKSIANFPYIPGYLSFREIPALISIFEELDENVDVILCDGHGIAHPRRFGIASHIGVILDKPSIGCAKSRLIGSYEEPPNEKGEYSNLYDGNEKIGIVLRTRNNVKPLFISPGNRLNFDDCRTIVLNCLTRYRIPEPLRFAHQYVNRIRMENQN